MRTAVEHLAGTLFDAGANHWRVLLVAVAAVWLAALAMLPWLPVDMSFRPLFASTPDVDTQRFEAEFGQPSGAFIVAMVAPVAGDAPSSAVVEAVSSAVEGIDHVTEVVSMTRLQVIQPTADGNVEVIAVPQEDQRVAGKAARVLSSDRRIALIAARVDLELADLAGRKPVVEAFEERVRAALPGGYQVQFTGVSTVEAAYSELVLINLLIGIALTVALVALLLWWSGGLPAAATGLTGVSVATPVSLALIALTGGSLTIVNAMVPTMVLVIGVADAIHMREAFLGFRRRGCERRVAARAGFLAMVWPCLLTTLTTAAGAFALLIADVAAVREFGVNVAMGVAAAFIANQVLVPVLLSRLPDGRQRRVAVTFTAARWVTQRPMLVLLGGAIIVSGALAALPGLSFDQRFNEELRPDHPVRLAQSRFEAAFDGFLGPELLIERRDGGGLVDRETMGRLSVVGQAVSAHADVLSVRSIADWPLAAVERLDEVRRSALAPHLKELVNGDGTQLSVIVRTNDMGSDQAKVFVPWLEAESARLLGNDYRVTTVGQWWLAQRGMQAIITDMTLSFCLAFVLVAPFLLLATRRPGLVFAAVIVNLLPAVVALGFMAAFGIDVRISTALVLAVALGIAVDDTLHLTTRLDRLLDRYTPGRAVEHALGSSGRALTLTTLVLLAGFASMMTNDLIAIADMGLVAAVSLLTAWLADVLLLPAMLLVFSRAWQGRRQAAGRSPTIETRSPYRVSGW
jgi:predicted RND superfamily exporter protein